MQVIGVGFGRTGTNSLKLALEALGFGPCLHASNLVPTPELTREWADLLTHRSVDKRAKLYELLSDYESTVDWPSCLVWSEMIRMYPAARVILTVRDPDSWVNSFVEALAPLWLNAMEKVNDPGLSQSPLGASYQLLNSFAQLEFGGRVFDPAVLKRRLLEHHEQVKAAVPQERLLVYSVSEGWPSLCEFLNVDVPSIEFPHTNDRAAFKVKQEEFFKLQENFSQLPSGSAPLSWDHEFRASDAKPASGR
ncbi:hypothetical protein MB901379_04482 [Mycobacterium basiliense]|uniref:Sulfotransferase family protein n=1 Tax=Mycobacterium basiliense TaxID=2094119 RepID=A0A447GK89_9MYCO|nr:sulfotransferase family protein [Mycobacterium basiliense]VDM90873.1 hypothetical protein MB901379_04482 [Mycobacterium basiliense]